MVDEAVVVTETAQLVDRFVELRGPCLCWDLVVDPCVELGLARPVLLELSIDPRILCGHPLQVDAYFHKDTRQVRTMLDAPQVAAAEHGDDFSPSATHEAGMYLLAFWVEEAARSHFEGF